MFKAVLYCLSSDGFLRMRLTRFHLLLNICLTQDLFLN